MIDGRGARRAGRAGGRRARGARRPRRAAGRDLARSRPRTVFEPDHPIRVGVLSRSADRRRGAGRGVPATGCGRSRSTTPGRRIAAMPRGALRVRTGGLELVDLPPEVEAAVVPGRALLPARRGRAGPLRRLRAAAAARPRRRPSAPPPTACSPARAASAPVVVLGDLNDEPLAATTQILLGPPGSEIGTAGFDRPDRGDAVAAVEPRAADPGGAPLHARVRRPPRADRPRARQPLPRHARERGRHRRRRGRRRSAPTRARAATSPRPTTRRCSRASTSERSARGQRRLDARARRRGGHVERPAEQQHPLAHAREAEARARRVRVEAAAVVGDAQAQRAVRPRAPRPRRARRRRA